MHCLQKMSLFSQDNPNVRLSELIDCKTNVAFDDSNHIIRGLLETGCKMSPLNKKSFIMSTLSI